MAFRPLGQPRCLKQRHEPVHLSAGAMWDSRWDPPVTSLLPCSIPSNGLVLSLGLAWWLGAMCGCRAVPFGTGSPSPLIPPKHGLRTERANHIFSYNTVLQKTFVASGTLFLPYVFLLNLAAPAAGRVSLLVSLES